MLTLETTLSSILVLAAFLLVFQNQIPQQNELIQFYDYTQISDYANLMAQSQSPCDFSKVSPDDNFCYSCALSSIPTVSYSNPLCAIHPPNSKLTAHIPFYSNNKIEKISISKYASPN